ncbi:MAG TPA: WYL domain-containing protein [Microlunatus sp.]
MTTRPKATTNGGTKQAQAQTSQSQVRRLLSLIPYLREHDGVAIADVAEAFGVTPERIREDLSVLWMCGLPGLSPGDLIDIDMDAVEGQGVIHLSNADYLTRPLRLSADEALALILALRTLRGVTARDDRAAIDRALEKLQAVAQVTDRAEVRVTGGREDIQGTVGEALHRKKRLELTYDVASRAETTHRFVDPLRVFVLDGYGYLDAWCYSANALRSFRLDRIAAVEITDADVAEHEVELRDLAGGWFDALKDAPLVTLALDRGAAWVAEYYPTEQVTPAEDGGLTVSLRVSDPVWLRGLLLRLGGGARVLAPDGAGDSAADAATEALDQYAALRSQR